MVFNVPKLVKAGAWKELTDPNKGVANWRGLRDPRGIKAVVAHHSVTVPKGNWEKEVEEVRYIHMNINGWGGIGYNIVVTTQESNGYAIAVLIGDLASIRAHTPNSKGAFGWPVNSGNVYLAAICMIGELHKYNPTPAQVKTMKAIAEELIYNEDERLPLLDSWDKFKTHKDFDQTACSGNFDWQKPAIMNANIGDAPAPQPEPQPQPGENLVWTQLPAPVEYVCNKQPTSLWNFNQTSWGGFANPVKNFNRGERITVYGKVFNKALNAEYYLTQYSFTNRITNGFNHADMDLYVAPPAPEPQPEPQPEPPKPDVITFKVIVGEPETSSIEFIEESSSRAKFEELKSTIDEGSVIALVKINKTKNTTEPLDRFIKPVTPKPDVVFYRVLIQGGRTLDIEGTKDQAVMTYNEMLPEVPEGKSIELREINVTQNTDTLIVTHTKPVTPKFNLIRFLINLIQKLWKRSGSSSQE